MARSREELTKNGRGEDDDDDDEKSEEEEERHFETRGRGRGGKRRCVFETSRRKRTHRERRHSRERKAARETGGQKNRRWVSEFSSNDWNGVR